jgi:ribosomal protein S21
MPPQMRVRDREPIGAGLRHFKKLIQRSGLT